MDNASQSTQDTPNVETSEEQKTVLTEESKTTEDTKQATDEASQSGETNNSTEEKETSQVPEKYDLKLPENSLIKEDAIEKISEYAKEQGLSNDQAQSLLERENEIVQGIEHAQQESLKEKAAQWVEDLKSDKDVGGEEFTKNAEMGKRFINRFGSDELKEILETSGLGNHPELFKMVVRASKAMSEDELLMPGEKPKKEKSLAEKMYGS